MSNQDIKSHLPIDQRIQVKHYIRWTGGRLGSVIAYVHDTKGCLCYRTQLDGETRTRDFFPGMIERNNDG